MKYHQVAVRQWVDGQIVEEHFYVGNLAQVPSGLGSCLVELPFPSQDRTCFSDHPSSPHRRPQRLQVDLYRKRRPQVPPGREDRSGSRELRTSLTEGRPGSAVYCGTGWGLGAILGETRPWYPHLECYRGAQALSPELIRELES